MREGNTQYRAGLRIGSKTDIENLCSCRESRGRGLICAHSLAVGLAVLQPPAPAAPPEPQPPGQGGLPEASDGVLHAAGGIQFSIEEGTPLGIRVVLPPNFAEGWERGVVSVAFEAESGGQRRPLGSFGKGNRYRVDARDFALLKELLRLTARELPGMLTLRPGQMERLLIALRGHGGVTLGRSRSVTLPEDSIRPGLAVKSEPDGSICLSIECAPDEKILSGVVSAWSWNDSEGILQSIAHGLPVAYFDLFRKASISIPASAAASFRTRELPMLQRWFDLPRDFDTSQLLPSSAMAPSLARDSHAPAVHLKIEGSLRHLAAEVEIERAGAKTTISSPGYRPRDPFEVQVLNRLRAAGFAGPNPRGEWTLSGETSVLEFFAKQLPVFQEEWKVSIGTRFSEVTKPLDRVRPRIEFQASGQNWFEVSFDLATSTGERLSAHEVRRLLASGQRTLKLSNQRQAILTSDLLDDFEELLRDTDPKQAMPGRYRFDARDAPYLESFAKEAGAELHLREPAALRLADEARDSLVEDIDLGALDGQLRDYQKHGIKWLRELSKRGLAGVLADEMGLGKTVQALGFLRSLHGPKLVICPASLTFNWCREADRFTPELRAISTHYLDAKRLAQALADGRLLVSSYGLLRRDIERIRSVEFAGIVLDEAQHIKNPDSQTAKAAHRLRGRVRVALTGTPIENGVRDIWSIMQFLMPGYLGDRERFKERFEQPIHSQPGGPAHRRLIQRLRPYMLRRTKREVVKELPEKIEQVAYCEMSKDQAALYGQILGAAQKAVHDAEQAGADAGARKLAAFTALLRLRQICCDPRLLAGPDSPEAAAMAGVESAKRELLRELLDDAVHDEHRVLVFSQFSRMLKLIAADLEEVGIAYCYLDGATRDRQAVVDRFQNGKAPVFLISLKAGGTGLNLTGADTVILYDPWWNPAVEAQAADRAHRIGQERTVTVYRLVTRGTVEEKILQLQEKKRAIAQDYGEDDEPLMSGLSFDEVSSLVDEA